MELADLGKQPIRPEQPAGDDVRYDPLYEELVAEVDKFSSPSASGAVDWDKVVRLSSDILAQKSKDLLVASYLAIALIQTKKFEGVEIGSRIYRDLIEGHWDALFPAKARMRGRVAAIEWWAEKAESVLEQLPKGPFAEERINALNENLQKVDQLLSEVLEEAPSIRPLLDFAGSLEAIAPPPEPKPASSAARPPEGSLGTPGAGPSVLRVEEGPVGITSPETAFPVLEKALGDISRVAEYYREESLPNPAAYRLARVAAWSAVESLPPSEDGRTNLPPPYAADSLRGLLGEGKDEALVRGAERNLAENIFWLDLNFWSSEALARMGEGYEAAAGAVRLETALLLRRLPGLEDLKFSDGTPFAADDTREWLKGLSGGNRRCGGGGRRGGRGPDRQGAPTGPRVDRGGPDRRGRPQDAAGDARRRIAERGVSLEGRPLPSPRRDARSAPRIAAHRADPEGDRPVPPRGVRPRARVERAEGRLGRISGQRGSRTGREDRGDPGTDRAGGRFRRDLPRGRIRR